MATVIITLRDQPDGTVSMNLSCDKEMSLLEGAPNEWTQAMLTAANIQSQIGMPLPEEESSEMGTDS